MPVKKWVTDILSLILGGIFFVSGISKIPTFSGFTATISELSYMSEDISHWVALAVIGIESVVGMMLLLRRQVKYASGTLIPLIAVYILILELAIINKKEVPCNCFGILPFKLSNSPELIVDVVLFNIAALLFYLSLKKKSVAHYGVREILCTILMVAGLFYLEVALIVSPFRIRNAPHVKEESILLSALKKLSPKFYYSKENRLIFLLRFHDFNCPLCYDDFLALSDSLNQIGGSIPNKVIALFEEDDIANPAKPYKLKSWADATGIRFPVFVIADSVFENFDVSKSTVLVVSQEGNVIFQGMIPIGEKSRRLAKEYLTGRKGG